MRTRKCWSQLLLFFASVLASTHAFAQASFYEGKTITIVLGTSPGGVGDLRLRALGPFLQKYIPGNPTIVIENMAGAGGRKAANHIFAAARADGLTIGGLLPGTIPDAITGQQGVLYNIDKLIYLGTPNSGVGHSALFTRKEAARSCVPLQVYGLPLRRWAILTIFSVGFSLTPSACRNQHSLPAIRGRKSILHS